MDYAKRDGGHVAYSLLGDGPLDVQYVSSYTISIDSLDEEPHVAHYFRRIAAFSRLGRFDVRGIGLSDPSNAELPMSVESMAADVLAVLDARGIDRTVLVGESGGGLAAIHLAATRPERVESLVLVNAFARAIADDDNPEGHPRELVDAFLQRNADLTLIAPSMQEDARFRGWWTRASRRGASPASARAMLTMTSYGDVRDRLSRITVPTLVIHCQRNRFI